jgi:hypothetical protein
MYLHSDTEGLKRLIDKYRSDFRLPENTEHYDREDYRIAERKYVKFCLMGDPHHAADGGTKNLVKVRHHPTVSCPHCESCFEMEI